VVVAVKQYVDPEGKSPFGEWLDGLDDPAAARVLTTVTRIAQGNFSSVKGVEAASSNRESTLAPAYGCISARTARRS